MCAQFLSQLQRKKLSFIISDVSEFKIGNENDIYQFLVSAGLSKFWGSFSLPIIPRNKASMVIDILERHGYLEESPGCHALGELLRHVNSLGEIGQDDKRFIATIIVEHRLLLDLSEVKTLCETYGVSSSQTGADSGTTQISIADQLNHRRAARSTTSPVITKYDRIDHDEILRKFDLIQQVHEMQTTISRSPRGSIVHFVTNSNPWLLQKYMIPRLLDVLEDTTGITLDYRQVSIATPDLINEIAAIDIIEQRMQAIYQDISWSKLFEACAERNIHGCFVYLESHGLQTAQLQQFATLVELEAITTLQSLLEATGQKLVICWVNSTDHPILPEKCFCVPKVESFTDDEVTIWFDSQLGSLGIAHEDVQTCKTILHQKLAFTRGEPVATYQAMQDIITSLSH